MALFSTNPYNNVQAANSKEYISLDKGAKQDFCPETCFDLIPGNSDAFSAKIKRYSKQFGYGSLLNVPTNRNIDTSDANKITYSSHVNIINTWNKISDDLTARNANEVWGTHDWTISSTKRIEEMQLNVVKLQHLLLLKLARRNSWNTGSSIFFHTKSWHCLHLKPKLQSKSTRMCTNGWTLKLMKLSKTVVHFSTKS
jgi:hypothetical protein